ncbi:Response regulator receiver domain-containing protein [Pedobacter westerhofensis]|uniref:histidine kinase n=1 Tax=Pedobacter westerhofensis TaxID=425512 RepID=A0A521AP72_9SPHI|nr:response regulator [Pedobacter westerhofensis]SMO36624.1 Response regulator receiver domain-containing protein [Pedobacter westerhofensis]
MKLSAHCDCYADNSYFLFNKKNQIISFRIHSTEKLGYFLDKNPVIGEPFVEFISQKYVKSFSDLVAECFEGKSFNIENRLKVQDKEDVLMQVVLTPVFTGPDQEFVACTIIDSNRKTNQMKLLDEYSHLASHDLRAPITNILSLSSMLNYPEMDSLDTSKIRELLTDINFQAEKLDDIIKMLNRLINKGEATKEFAGEATVIDSKHIMLVDDDSLTNKLHHMIITKHNKNKRVVQFDRPLLALNYLKENHPDLILLDLNMPEMDGWAFLRALEERNIKIDVVIISSTIDPAERSRAQSFKSVKDFLTKPLTYDKIKHLVDN